MATKFLLLKINKFDKLLATSTKRYRRLNKVRDEIEHCKSQEDIQRIRKRYFKNLYFTKVGKMDKMDEYMCIYIYIYTLYKNNRNDICIWRNIYIYIYTTYIFLPKLNHNEENNLSGSIKSNKTEVITIIWHKKAQDHMDIMSDCISPSRKNQYQYSSNCPVK